METLKQSILRTPSNLERLKQRLPLLRTPSKPSSSPSKSSATPSPVVSRARRKLPNIDYSEMEVDLTNDDSDRVTTDQTNTEVYDMEYANKELNAAKIAHMKLIQEKNILSEALKRRVSKVQVSQV